MATWRIRLHAGALPLRGGVRIAGPKCLSFSGLRQARRLPPRGKLRVKLEEGNGSQLPCGEWHGVFRRGETPS
jgi:hypothetical protein